LLILIQNCHVFEQLSVVAFSKHSKFMNVCDSLFKQHVFFPISYQLCFEMHVKSQSYMRKLFCQSKLLIQDLLKNLNFHIGIKQKWNLNKDSKNLKTKRSIFIYEWNLKWNIFQVIISVHQHLFDTIRKMMCWRYVWKILTLFYFTSNIIR